MHIKNLKEDVCVLIPEFVLKVLYNLYHVNAYQLEKSWKVDVDTRCLHFVKFLLVLNICKILNWKSYYPLRSGGFNLGKAIQLLEIPPKLKLFALHLVPCSTHGHHPAYGIREGNICWAFSVGDSKRHFERRRAYFLNPEPPWPEFSLVQDFLCIFIIIFLDKDRSSELSFPPVTSFLFLFPRRFILILNGTTILHFTPTFCFPVSIPHDFCLPTIHTLFHGSNINNLNWGCRIMEKALSICRSTMRHPVLDYCSLHHLGHDTRFIDFTVVANISFLW